MIDLTPLEVRKKKGDFKKTMRGYDPALVDDFLDLVADRLDQLVRENNSMIERLSRLETQMGEHRDRERALTDALVTAQEMREEMRQQTAREAELMRRDAEQESKQVRAAAEQESKQVRAAADQEAKRIRTEAVQAREREEEVLRRLRARQQQLLQSYRTFLAREMAELQVIGETLEIEGMSATTFPAPMQREVEEFAPSAAPAREIAREPAPAPAPRAERLPEPEPFAPPVMPAPQPLVPPVMPAAEPFVPPISRDPEPYAPPAARDEQPVPHDPEPMMDIPELTMEPAAEEPPPMRMLDEPMEMNLQTDLLDHAMVMGALEVAILEDDEPFAPEPVDEWDEEETADTTADAEDIDDLVLDLAAAEEDFAHQIPEIGAPDADATILLENALKAGYRIELDDDEDGDELLLDDAQDDEENEDAEPPRGWLDKMIDDEERR